MVNTPVLFETFVRVDYARQVWDAIKAAQPRKLYFYSNKGRVEKEGEIERNNEIRSWVNEIDWDCDLHTWFREECVDVYTSLKGAISWFFENEEEGIILEDDCVPSLAFFDYCEKMLLKYKDEKKIFIISGDNYIEDQYKAKTDYLFSRDFQIYGWATWKDRWNKIDWNADFVKTVLKSGALRNFYPEDNLYEYHKYRLLSYKNFINKTHCWDLMLYYTALQHNCLCLVPSANLVEDIGLVGTHGNQSKKSAHNKGVTYNNSSFSIKNEPAVVEYDPTFDQFLFAAHYSVRKRSVISKIKLNILYFFPSVYNFVYSIKHKQ